MNRKLFLCLVLTACVVIAYLATFYPVATLATATCSLPFLFIWAIITDDRIKDKRFKEREQQWRDNCDLPHRKGR